MEASISRAMHEIAAPEHIKFAQRFKQVYSKYQQQKDLISVGAYQSGSDAATDEAISLYPRLTKFLQQGMHESVTLKASLDSLQTVLQSTQSKGPPVHGANSAK